MTRNEITNQIELNLQETHLLRRLDEKCVIGNPVEIDINDVPATISADRSGFIAVWGDKRAFGVTASNAFLELMK